MLPTHSLRFIQGGVLHLEKRVRILDRLPILYMGLSDLLSVIRIESQLGLTSLNVSSVS